MKFDRMSLITSVCCLFQNPSIGRYKQHLIAVSFLLTQTGSSHSSQGPRSNFNADEAASRAVRELAL